MAMNNEEKHKIIIDEKALEDFQKQIEAAEEKTEQIPYSFEELSQALDDYLTLGEIRKVYLINPKIRVTFRSLTLKELAEINKIYNEPDILKQPIIVFQIPTLKKILLYAIDDFNGEGKLTEEKIDNMPVPLIEALRQKYIEFQTFCNYIFSNFDELIKKNS